jgi:hypothetical protein
MKILLTISLMVFSSGLFSQTVLKIKNAEENKINIAELDSIYKSGFHVDTSLAVFKTNPEEYYQAWVKFNQELGKFLSANEFFWEKTIKGFNRIYFNKNGGIDYWLYSFDEGQISKEKEDRFEELLRMFSAEHKFSLIAETGFAQCGGAQYQASKKKEH